MNLEIECNEIIEDLSHNLPAAVFTYTVDEQGNDSIRYISDYCESIWGVPPTEVVKNSQVIWDLTYPEDVKKMKESIAHSIENMSKWECEWRIIPLNDTKIKWLRGYGTPRINQDGNVAWNTVILDVTKEHQLQTAEKDALKNTINVLVAALEARDPYTAGHGKSVAQIAEAISKKLNLPAENIEGIFIGGLIHDIGKISTPAEILTKPTKLLDEEYSLIQLHPSTGSKFFKDIPMTWPIKEMIEQHHERLDGSGYPKGLKGDQITFEARIIAVADVLDSIASNRPYRLALGIEKAMEILKKGSGSKFDSTVVEALIVLIESGELTLENN